MSTASTTTNIHPPHTKDSFAHDATTWAKRGAPWLALFWALCTLSSCMATVQRAPSSPCPRLHHGQITGWIELLEKPCVWISRPDTTTFYVHHESLPYEAKEGDYLEQGQIQSKQPWQREHRKLIESRPAAPDILIIPQDSTPQTPPKTSSRRRKTILYSRGRWRQWRRARRKQAQTRRRPKRQSWRSSRTKRRR